MFDLHDVYDVIFYDKEGNKLFKFDKIKSLNIDMNVSAGEAMEFDCHITSYEFDIYEPHNITVPINEIDMNTAEGNKPVKTIFEDENKRNLNENVKSIFENLDQDKLDQEEKNVMIIILRMRIGERKITLINLFSPKRLMNLKNCLEEIQNGYCSVWSTKL